MVTPNLPTYLIIVKTHRVRGTNSDPYCRLQGALPLTLTLLFGFAFWFCFLVLLFGFEISNGSNPTLEAQKLFTSELPPLPPTDPSRAPRDAPEPPKSPHMSRKISSSHRPRGCSLILPYELNRIS